MRMLEKNHKMGERPKPFLMWAPTHGSGTRKLDSFKKHLSTSPSSLLHIRVGEKFEIEKGKFLLVSHHPVTTQFGQNRHAVEETLYALQELAMPTIMLWPNADAGSEEISKGIRSFREKYQPKWLYLFTNLPIEVYVRLMSLKDYLTSNSSVLYVKDLVARQLFTWGRQRASEGLFWRLPSEHDAIGSVIRQRLAHGPIPESLYGDGTAGCKSVDILAKIEVPNVQKVINY